jgi:hypothetical protein
MPLKIKLTGVGLTVRHALQIGGTVANGLTATGTNQGTALLLSYDDCQVFTTVGIGTGCIFAGATVYCAGDQVIIANHGADALLVYPATGGTIAAKAANASFSLASKSAALFESIDGLNWAVLGAGGSGGAFGFGFSAGGVLIDGEILGFGLFPSDRTFTTGDPSTKVESEAAATGSSVFNVQTYVAGVRTTVGTITFAASAAVGTVAWTSSPYTLPAFTIIELHAPSPADATLSWVTGRVNAVAA